MTFDRKRNQLLIACKGDAGLDKKQKKNVRAIYAFDLDHFELLEKPLIVLKEKDLKMLNGGQDFPFEPSAIAIDEESDKIFLLSSVGKSIVSINFSGKPDEIIFLDERIFQQPEGLIIRNSNFLIVSEGKGDVAKLILYEKQN